VGLRLVRDGLTSPDDPNAELLDELDRGVRDSIQALRDLAHGIYPPLLRDAGLGDALRAAGKRSPLDVRVDAADVGRLPEQAEAAVYFCCLEALQNASKHAPGSTVTVTLRVEGSRLTVVVADDGPGFDPANVAGGGGLQNMADRLGAIGGTIELVSAPGAGTRLTGHIPVPAREEPARPALRAGAAAS
jgi:signal transduction histidine kinase